MAVIHHDTYVCDICGKDMGEDCYFKGEVPVIFHTEQNEGMPCRPYFSRAEVHLCRECAAKAINIHANGCMGYNEYFISDNRPSSMPERPGSYYPTRF